ncbi:MAG: hypothetical protein OXQ32_02060 [bacterium]|nr:hypothetical protein [bacterium]
MTRASHYPENETEWIEEAVIQILDAHGAILSANRITPGNHPTPDYEVCLPPHRYAWLEITQLTDSLSRQLFAEGRVDIPPGPLLEQFTLFASPGVNYKHIRRYQDDLVEMLLHVEQSLLAEADANRKLKQVKLSIVSHVFTGRRGKISIYPSKSLDEAIVVEGTKHLRDGVQFCIDSKSEKRQMANTPERYERWLAIWIDYFMGEAFLELHDRETPISLDVDLKCFDMIVVMAAWNNQATLLPYPGDSSPVRVPFDPSQLSPPPSPLTLPNGNGSPGYSRLWTPSKGDSWH